ncbi:MAG: hypothetical protein RI895_1515 [Actinomycetota bacterium]|jgi:photosystem II stability/assembly factor-like uncharacterized protein
MSQFGKLTIGLGLLALLAGCGTSDNQASTAGSTNGQIAQANSEFGGVHNLLITDDGILFGTHHGVWLQRKSQDPVPVGDSRFDVMGLAKHAGGLVASGHPDSTEEQVGNIGLRGSTDQGRTWKNISLTGQVDFHRLVSSGQMILGLSATDGALLVSNDSGKNWEALPNPNLYDLALDPSNPSNVVGTTETGPILSKDGGRTFAPIAGAPLLALLSWDTARLVGVTPDGLIYESLDQGATWSQIASVTGQMRAIAARGEEIAVLAGTDLYYSSDAGRNFTIRLTGISGH